MNKPLQSTLADAVSFLDERQIPYAMIGGLAASLRGEPRVTADVDIVIGVDVERAVGLLPQLVESPFDPIFSGVEEVVRKALILPLRHRDTGVKVDLSLGLSGFEQQAITRAERIQVAGTLVSIATAEDLLVMKLLAGRPRDEQDIQGIAIVQGKSLDWDYCQQTASDLGKAVGQDLVSRMQKLREEYGGTM